MTKVMDMDSFNFFRGILLTIVCGVIAGCGLQNYEKRLEETSKYYTYLAKIDSNLAPPWKDGPIDELRVPLQFKAIRKPAPVKNAEGEMEEPPDPRQPNYIALELPGMLGAWEAPFDKVVDGAKQTRKGYIYVVSNYSMFNSELSSQAPDFLRTLLGTISDRLSLPAIEPGKRGTGTVSQGEGRRVQPFRITTTCTGSTPTNSSLTARSTRSMSTRRSRRTRRSLCCWCYQWDSIRPHA